MFFILNPWEEWNKSVTFIVLDSPFFVDGINKNEAAPGFIIFTTEPRFDEVHQLSSNHVISPLKLASDAKTANEHSGICPASLIVCYMLIKFSFRVIGKMSSLNSGISQSNHCNNLRVIAFKKPTIGLTHEVFIIGNSIIGEEIIKIVFATNKFLAMVKNITSEFNHDAICLNIDKRLAYCLLHDGTYSLERCRKSEISFCRSGETSFLGFLSFSSALSMKFSASSPVRIGTALIGVAIFISFLLQSYEYKTSYTRL